MPTRYSPQSCRDGAIVSRRLYLNADVSEAIAEDGVGTR